MTVRRILGRHRGYLVTAGLCCASAAVLAALPGTGVLPVLGTVPLLPVTLISAFAGAVLLHVLGNLAPLGPAYRGRHIAQLLALGAVLALPPIAIDLAMPFPRGMNLPLPGALFFYLAIALVAEVVFHLVPLAALNALLPRRVSRLWLFLPVVFVEPLFQAMVTDGPALQSWLVIGNVSLISATQLWLFRRYGFVAMIGVRLAFYLFWHILWGALRLPLLF